MKIRCQNDYPIYMEQNYLDHDLDCDLSSNPENVPIYTGYSLFNTMYIILLLIVQSLLHSNLPNIWI